MDGVLGLAIRVSKHESYMIGSEQHTCKSISLAYFIFFELSPRPLEVPEPREVAREVGMRHDVDVNIPAMTPVDQALIASLCEQ